MTQKDQASQHEWDVFISHAREDEDEFVRPLAASLAEEGWKVWFDEFALRLGDRIGKSIDEGLLRSRFCVVVLSKNYFEKDWPQEELQAALRRQVTAHQRYILPVRHGVLEKEVDEKFPRLADIRSISSDEGLSVVVDSISDAIKVEGATVPKGLDIAKFSGQQPQPPSVKELRPIETEPALFRAPSSEVRTLFDLIGSDFPPGFAVVDLGEGSKWLTSRMFIFALILKRMCDLRQFVFVEVRAEAGEVLVGTASPDDVRWSLAMQYPWLEAAYSEAYAKLVLLDDPGIRIISTNGALELADADQLITHFVRQLQKDRKPAGGEQAWVSLGGKSIWEHASWLDGEQVQRLLGDKLETSRLVVSHNQSFEDQKMKLLHAKGEFVALVNEDGSFDKLIDRHALMESEIGAPDTKM